LWVRRLLNLDIGILQGALTGDRRFIAASEWIVETNRWDNIPAIRGKPSNPVLIYVAASAHCDVRKKSGQIPEVREF
jgi:hypothetical protein